MKLITVEYKLINKLWQVEITDNAGYRTLIEDCKTKRQAQRSANDILKHLRKSNNIKRVKP